MKKTKIRAELKGRELPHLAEVIRQRREEREVQLFMAQGEERLRQLALQRGRLAVANFMSKLMQSKYHITRRFD